MSGDWIARLARGPFGASASRGAALIVARGDPASLAFATPAALAVFGVRDLSALEAVLFGSQSFGARRLRLLAQTLTPGAPPRMESLRFFVGRIPVAIGWQCARVLDEQGEALFVAAAPVRAAEVPVEAPAVEPPAAEPPPEPVAAPPEETRLRFLWRMDRDGRFAAPDPALLDRLGADSPQEGETIAAFSTRVGLDPDAEWGGAIAARRTFSALRVAWRQAATTRARVAHISGAPVLDSNRAYAGFRGFGVLTGEWTEVAPARLEAAPSPEAPEDETPATAPIQEPNAPAGALLDADVFVPMASNPAASADSAMIETVAADAPAETPPPPGPPIRETDLLAVLDLPPVSDPPADPPAAEALTAAADEVAEMPDAPPVPEEQPLAPPEKPAPAPPRSSRDKSAEIFAFRPGSAQPVPHIRPGVFSVLNALSTVAESSSVGDSVALSSQERDAFKEIARALGVRLHGPRLDPEPEEPANAPPEPPAEAVLAAPEPPPPALTGHPDDLASLLDQLPIGALVLRGDEPLYLNRTLLDLVGYPSAEDFRARKGLGAIFLGRDPQALTPRGDGGGTPLIAAGGEMITVDAQARPLSWQGEPAVLIAMRRSREADHQAQVRALELEARHEALLARDYSTALDAVSDGLVRVDFAGRILAMNSGAESLFGYDQKETAGENFLMLLAPSSHAAVTTALDRIVRAESEAETLELDLRDRSGRIAPARVDLGRFVAGGESEYFVLLTDLSGVRSDDAARQEALEIAEKASAAKTEFLARVSHEIRTPLQAILGFAEVMLEERFGPVANERYKDYIRDIHVSGRHVMSLANDLLDLAKIEAGKMELQFAPVDVNRVIRECVGLMQPQAARERIIVRLSLYDKLPQVMADERSLRQIVFNLLSNAVKYNEPGGQVIVSTALDEAGHTIVRVRDTGVGMNETELASALEPFQRLAGSRKVEGSGLGLPLTKALVEANHADFAIKSRKEQGTLVEVAFPGMRAAQ